MQEIGNKSLTEFFYPEGYEKALHALRVIELTERYFTIALLHRSQPLAFERFELTDGMLTAMPDDSRLAELTCEKPTLVLSGFRHALLTPASFLDKEALASSGLAAAGSSFEWLESRIPDFPASVCFPFPSVYLNFLRKKFPGLLFVHRCIPVFKWMLQHALIARQGIYIEVNRNETTVFAIRNQKPLLYNVYDTAVPEDVAYYTLAAMEYSELNPVNQAVYYKAEKGCEPLLEVCRNYVSALIPAEHLLSESFRGSGILFPALTHAYLCES